MPTVELTDVEWQNVLAFMAFAPARDCMPLLNKIGAQLVKQSQPSFERELQSVRTGNSHQEKPT